MRRKGGEAFFNSLQAAAVSETFSMKARHSEVEDVDPLVASLLLVVRPGRHMDCVFLCGDTAMKTRIDVVT